MFPAGRPEPVVYLELAAGTPLAVLDGVRATALAVLDPPPPPGHRSAVLVDLSEPAEAVASQAAALPGVLAVGTASADDAPGPGADLPVTAWCPASGPVAYWLVAPPRPAS